MKKLFFTVGILITTYLVVGLLILPLLVPTYAYPLCLPLPPYKNLVSIELNTHPMSYSVTRSTCLLFIALAYKNPTICNYSIGQSCWAQYGSLTHNPLECEQLPPESWVRRDCIRGFLRKNAGNHTIGCSVLHLSLIEQIDLHCIPAGGY